LDKSKQVEPLKSALDEIPRLRRLTSRDGEFTMWKDEVCRILESEYGLKSTEYRRFANAPGTSFIVRTELGQEQEYQRQLDCYGEALKSLVDGD